MTFEEVDEQLTLPRYNSLCRFWSKHPPMSILLEGYVGFKGKEPATEGGVPQEMDSESMGALIEMFGMPPVRTKGDSQ